jgi:hypothetical protein
LFHRFSHCVQQISLNETAYGFGFSLTRELNTEEYVFGLTLVKVDNVP